MLQGSFSGFNAESPAEPVPELSLLEKFLVTATSTSCKCVVTATSTIDKQIIAIAVRQCKGHQAVIDRLTAAAKFRVAVMVDIFGSTSTVLKHPPSTSTPKKEQK